ncbi:MAG TPA: hypothetical protein VH144_01755 [Candidatus Saccharimonadales bacterium]|jgi:hypothetical protein|nr:hypothetical protein [Candidatus Saccharimonadales bacterium]
MTSWEEIQKATVSDANAMEIERSQGTLAKAKFFESLNQLNRLIGQFTHQLEVYGVWLQTQPIIISNRIHHGIYLTIWRNASWDKPEETLWEFKEQQLVHATERIGLALGGYLVANHIPFPAD